MLRRATVLSVWALTLALIGCTANHEERRGSGQPSATAVPAHGPPTEPPAGFVEPPGALYASPDGGGTSCSREAPCDVMGALGQAGSGVTVALLAGDYGELIVSSVRALERAAAPVTVMPAQGASAVVRGLDLRSPNTVWQGVHFTGPVMIRGFAPHTELKGVHIDGAGVFVRAKDVTVRDSLLENGVSTDGIQVGQAEDVLITGNRIRNFAQHGASGFHSDCIQMFDSRGIVIRANVLSNCYNASLIFSPGRGDGTHEVLIESNFIQGCRELDADCRGGVGLDMRTTDTNTHIVVRNNTFVDGAVRAGTLPSSVFDRNYVEYLSYCETPMSNSVISAWNKGLCDSPENLGKKGNRQGSAIFLDQGVADLRVNDPAQVAVAPLPGTAPAPQDLFGNPLAFDTAGAYAP